SGASAWHDPVFNHPLSFYLFELPFYSELLRIVLGLSVVAAVLYWLTVHGWQLRRHMPKVGQGNVVDLSELDLTGAFDSRFLSGMVAVFLVALSIWFYL